jgi:hypothetical protein
MVLEKNEQLSSRIEKLSVRINIVLRARFWSRSECVEFTEGPTAPDGSLVRQREIWIR